MVPLSKQDLMPSRSMRLSMLSKGKSSSLAIEAQSQWRCTSSNGSLSRAACAAAALELAGTHATRDEAAAAVEAATVETAGWLLAKFASRGLVEAAADAAAAVEAAAVEGAYIC